MDKRRVAKQILGLAKELVSSEKKAGVNNYIVKEVKDGNAYIILSDIIEVMMNEAQSLTDKMNAGDETIAEYRDQVDKAISALGSSMTALEKCKRELKDDLYQYGEWLDFKE